MGIAIKFSERVGGGSVARLEIEGDERASQNDIRYSDLETNPAPTQDNSGILGNYGAGGAVFSYKILFDALRTA
jgi:hypothetical protein